MLLLGVLQAQAAGAVGAGSFDLLDERVLDSAESSVVFSSLSTYAADYQHLQIRGVIREDGAGSGMQSIPVRFNSNADPTYKSHRLAGNGSTVISNVTAATDRIQIFDILPETSSNANSFGAFIFDILDFSSSTKTKTLKSLHGGTTDGEKSIQLASGLWADTSPITEITCSTFGNSFVTGSRFSLYGIRGS